MKDRASPAPVVVGVDGSRFSARALDWAIEEASREDRPLWLISAWAMDYTTGMIGTLVPFLQQECQDILAEARARVAARARALAVTTRVVHGHPAAALIEASERAWCVVVGSRGLGSVQGALAGSTSIAVAAHAHCPVVVVHEHNAPAGADRRVVVGVDGSPGSAHTLQYAFEQASVRRLGLSVVHAWGVTLLEGTMALTGLIDNLQDLAKEREALAGEWVTPWREKYSDVAVDITVTQAPPVHALAEASREAELLVVGHRGHGGFTRLLLGSVSRGVLHHAGCPVAVIRAHPSPEHSRTG